MFPSLGSCFTARLLGIPAQPVCCPAQRDLPQCRQIIPDKEVIQRPGSLMLLIDFAGLKPGNQVIRFNIHQLHLIRRVKYRIGNPLVYRNLRNRSDQIMQ